MSNDLNTPLKPCPFCGGEPEISNRLGERWWQVICKSCHSQTGEIKNDLDRTIANWNRREPSAD
jgi:Lar family restriction alleviation protein